MAVDPYAPCPCGSGKKLKFCCADLAADIEKIDKLVSSDQPQAALRHVEKLLAKDPDRASLLDMRAMLELALHDFDAAEKTLQHFLGEAPGQPLGSRPGGAVGGGARRRAEGRGAAAGRPGAYWRRRPARVYSKPSAASVTPCCWKGSSWPPAPICCSTRAWRRRATIGRSNCCCG